MPSWGAGEAVISQLRCAPSKPGVSAECRSPGCASQQQLFQGKEIASEGKIVWRKSKNGNQKKGGVLNEKYKFKVQPQLASFQSHEVLMPEAGRQPASDGKEIRLEYPCWESRDLHAHLTSGSGAVINTPSIASRVIVKHLL